MATLTTLVCLFHHAAKAHAALDDLLEAGLPRSSIRLIGEGSDDVDALDRSELASIGMPDYDYDHLKHGIREGGLVISVSATGEEAATVESIFEEHSAQFVDEVDKSPSALPAVERTTQSADAAVIPLVEERLDVAKRAVDEGGVRVYGRTVEVPVEKMVLLRDEHVVVEHVPTDRLATDGETTFQTYTIELTETSEALVVAKEARVVEEVVVSKQALQRTEQISETLRHTEVEVVEESSAT